MNEASWFITIPADVLLDPRLSSGEILLYGEITGLCNQHGVCVATNEYFVKLNKVSDRTITRWIQNLIDCGYLDAKYSTEEFGTKRWLKIASSLVKKPPVTDVTPDTNGGQNIKNNNTNTNDKYMDCIKEIIDYLNTKAGTKYKYSTASTQKHIRGRLSDNYTVNDFKTVIDKKVLEWKGTDMERYLSPDTLFSPSKFEKYLNQNIRQPANKGQLSSRWTGGIGN